MRSFTAAYFSLVVVLGLLVVTGLVPDWGQWYSDFLTYRWQTGALLDGGVALGADARYIAFDLVWTKGKVQQVWGLGVPVWRLPFEVAAGLFGQPAFPDRLAFGAAWAFLAFAVLRLFVIPSKPADPLAYLKERPERICAFFLLVLFPPLLTMSRFRFIVFEEAAAYAYLAGAGLFAGTLFFFRRRTYPVFLGLTLAAGLAPFVRPTLLAYSVTTLLIALYCAWRAGWPYRRLAAGVLLFGLGGILLLASNQHRFGSGLEFGHSLTLNDIDSMRYTSRFDHPYATEPLGSASVELVSGMFFAGNRFNGYDWYDDGIIPGQSPTHRWREFYFTTYDASFLLMLAAGLGAWAVRKVKRKKLEGRSRAGETAGQDEGGRRTDEGSETDLMIVWALIACVPIFLFYLRAPFIASRYLLDFGPAFAVGLSAFAFRGSDWLRARSRSPGRAGVMVLAVFAIWWGWQVFRGDGAFPAVPVLTGEQVESRMTLSSLRDASFDRLPETYGVGMDSDSRWPQFNTDGWDLETGVTKAAVTLFVPALSELQIEIGPAGESDSAALDYEKIRAKAGLEFLELKEIEATGEGRRLVFDGPTREIYRNGVQVVFLGFVNAEEATHGDSEFRLLRVTWDGEE